MQMKNLPTQDSGIAIKTVVDGSGAIRVQTGEGWLITEIRTYTTEAMLFDIAAAIREARDIGFEQGLESIRRALGVKN